jgi:glycerol kinase
MGAAFLAGLAVGVWENQTEIRNLRQEEKTFSANISRANAEQKMEDWSRAVERSKDWIVP